jgi:hypothetical protein
VKNNVTLKSYDHRTNEIVEEGEVSLMTLAGSLDTETFAVLFDNFLNRGGKGFRYGEQVGEQLRFAHRTLQGLAYEFCLGVIVGLSEQEHADMRNHAAVENGKKIKFLLENGELKHQPYV